MPLEVPSHANQRWSMDFVADQLSNGRRFRVLNIVDDFTREMVDQFYVQINNQSKIMAIPSVV
jgi:transposase InsO family protein